MTIDRAVFTLICILLFGLSGSFSILKGAPSYAFGTVLSLLIFSVFIFAYKSFGILTVKSKVIYIYLLFAVFILIQYVGSSLIYSTGDVPRFLVSMFLLFMLLLYSSFFVNYCSYLNAEDFNKGLHAVYWIITLVAIAYILLTKFGSLGLTKMLFVREPSHFTLLYAPFLGYVALFSRKRYAHLFLGLVISLVIMNLTMIVGVLLCALLLSKVSLLRLFYIIPIACLVVGGVIFIDESGYILSRLVFGEDTTNLSTIVFLSGWERAYLSFFDSLGVGVGFQQMGINGPQGAFMQVLENTYQNKLNLLDGGTLGAKLITETGLFGILVLLAYLGMCKGYYREIQSKGESIRHKRAFFIVVFVTSLLQFFIRGVGYFSPFGYLFICSLYFLLTDDGEPIKKIAAKKFGNI